VIELPDSEVPARVNIGEDKWHWDRRVPIALIVTLFLSFAGQSFLAVWWASKIDFRVSDLEKISEKQATTVAPNSDRLTRVEVKLETVQAGIAEIKDILRTPRPK
jgi:type II secretory pathway component PulL